MFTKPAIFLSAVSKELSYARINVANVLLNHGFLVYEQKGAELGAGNLLQDLEKRIRKSKFVVQIVGQCSGAEPEIPPPGYERVSYTQYEAFYAQQQKKKIYFLVVHETDFPVEGHAPESDDLWQLQADYREAIRGAKDYYHEIQSMDALENRVLKISNKMMHLHRQQKFMWASLFALIIALAGGIAWLNYSESERTQLDFQSLKEQQRLKDEELAKKADEDKRKFENLERRVNAGDKLSPQEERDIAELDRIRFDALPPLVKARYCLQRTDFLNAQIFALEAKAAAKNDKDKLIQSLLIAAEAAQSRSLPKEASAFLIEAIDVADIGVSPHWWGQAQTRLARLRYAADQFESVLAQLDQNVLKKLKIASQEDFVACEGIVNLAKAKLAPAPAPAPPILPAPNDPSAVLATAEVATSLEGLTAGNATGVTEAISKLRILGSTKSPDEKAEVEKLASEIESFLLAISRFSAVRAQYIGVKTGLDREIVQNTKDTRLERNGLGGDNRFLVEAALQRLAEAKLQLEKLNEQHNLEKTAFAAQVKIADAAVVKYNEAHKEFIVAKFGALLNRGVGSLLPDFTPSINDKVIERILNEIKYGVGGSGLGR